MHKEKHGKGGRLHGSWRGWVLAAFPDIPPVSTKRLQQNEAEGQ
jgi:hypothetical protein